MNDFFEKMKTMVDKSVDVSQQALVKAGAKIQELGDKGITKIELNRLERQSEKCFAKLGLLVYDILICKQKTSVTIKNAEISALLDEIEHIKREMEIRAKEA
ncbi:hypothetical protein H0R92_13595 [Treponema sp. OMZ 840]|uniref:hypothetical protein n=1 Tax=Treponema sp. OMZ 840 TaxID=244313 RepID=UPI003D9008CC